MERQAMDLKQVGRVTIESKQVRIIDPSLSRPGEGTYVEFPLPANGICPVYEFEHEGIRYAAIPVAAEGFAGWARLSAALLNGEMDPPE